MSHPLIEKAREQRLTALRHLRRKSMMTEFSNQFWQNPGDGPEITNIFDIADWGLSGSNVVAFRSQRPEVPMQSMIAVHAR